jgi:hypothetical protein
MDRLGPLLLSFAAISSGRQKTFHTKSASFLGARERLHDATIQKKLLAGCASADCVERLRYV